MAIRFQALAAQAAATAVEHVQVLVVLFPQMGLTSGLVRHKFRRLNRVGLEDGQAGISILAH